MWQLWSPDWRFDSATFDRTAEAFDNPDFVDVVIHSYRHRFAYAPGDPAFEAIEQRLAAQPAIPVPTRVLHGGSDGVVPADQSERHARHFTGPCQRSVLPGIGHNLPQEAPDATVAAILGLLG